ncbi:hypothetical protein SELMODRAFT_166463 [Selaginella moellendorffii]|uniref:Thioredoxin domain-containing protein n=1 Tax=Selaginella moellendorffii TaxID=88036 RepID=D8QYT7_SELML|nr:thioredoxin H5 [Selaginella moellendorffii]EFJ34297.1 hypothetical protein SELMODRAFT_166463 [Selaginella moellendorffii]|eukprot:XP_002963964.1 thioredoxin H5 [Selaginella moellendorffii]
MATETVCAITSVELWQAKFKEAEEGKKLLVVDFTATWCGPCKAIAPIFLEYSKTFTDAIFVKVDVDQMPAITTEWKVEAMPTFLLIKEGKVVDKIVGADKDQLKKKLQLHTGAGVHA